MSDEEAGAARDDLLRGPDDPRYVCAYCGSPWGPIYGFRRAYCPSCERSWRSKATEQELQRWREEQR